MTTSQLYSITEILNFVKENLTKKGYDTLRILGKTFRDMNSYDGISKINKDEFLAGLRDVGILLPKNAAEKLVQYFDKDIDGCVSFDDFLVAIRAKPNETRQEIIDRAFYKFDKEECGRVDVRDLKGVFNSNLHPQVLSGQITSDQAFDHFLKNFNDIGGGKVSKYEWDDYYAAVSYGMSSCEHFVYLVKSVWQLD